MIRDLLSQLHTVGSTYAPLIYDLPKDASCQALVGRCKGLWGDLDKHPNLSQILVGSYELSIIPFFNILFMLTFTQDSCNKRLGEFQRIKEALGDVEKNAFKLMEAINASGVYKIESLEGKVLHSVDDAITLKVKGDTDNEMKYDLDKLRDLHSKLVLVSGTATKTNEDKFLAVCSLVYLACTF